MPSLAPSDPNPAIRVYMADLTSNSACRAFAEHVLEQLHGAEVEAVETSAKSRRGCCRVDVRFDSHVIAGTRPFLELILQCFSSQASILHSTCNPSTSTSTASLPMCFKIYQPFITQTSLYASDTINCGSSFPRDRHTKNFLHC